MHFLYYCQHCPCPSPVIVYRIWHKRQPNSAFANINSTLYHCLVLCDLLVDVEIRLYYRLFDDMLNSGPKRAGAKVFIVPFPRQRHADTGIALDSQVHVSKQLLVGSTR
jgi:hypothetical protein